jgi:hypothetical protein
MPPQRSTKYKPSSQVQAIQCCRTLAQTDQCSAANLGHKRSWTATLQSFAILCNPLQSIDDASSWYKIIQQFCCFQIQPSSATFSNYKLSNADLSGANHVKHFSL